MKLFAVLEEHEAAGQDGFSWFWLIGGGSGGFAELGGDEEYVVGFGIIITGSGSGFGVDGFEGFEIGGGIFLNDGHGTFAV